MDDETAATVFRAVDVLGERLQVALCQARDRDPRLGAVGLGRKWRAEQTRGVDQIAEHVLPERHPDHSIIGERSAGRGLVLAGREGR
ncbi:MAG: hypothetical protein HC897_06640 [Thermoanaerobaculia bacterium]|nr:hypothetical protein [Thermoanaerobaculia bacterium]